MSVLYEIDIFILVYSKNVITKLIFSFYSSVNLKSLIFVSFYKIMFIFPLLAGFSISNGKRVIFISNATKHKVNQMQTSHIILQ